MTPDQLRAALTAAVPDHAWVDEARASVAADPTAIARLFPRAARACGRAPLPTVPGWTADEAARALLLTALPEWALGEEIGKLYRYGDAAEKRAVLRALPLLPIGAGGVPLLEDALRTNDTRLVGAAMGPYAAHLDVATWRQGVLKCVFMGIPLSTVDGLDERADGELGVMLDGLVRERTAAGRDMAPDAVTLLHRISEREALREAQREALAEARRAPHSSSASASASGDPRTRAGGQP